MRRRSSFDQARESLRLQQVYNVFLHYGMDFVFDRGIVGDARRFLQEKLYQPPYPLFPLSAPVKTRLMIQELGPTYVKVGQIVSSQAQALPSEWAAELAKLQSNVPPFPSEEVHEIIVAELGAPPEELFQTFAAVPFAAASTAQVHRASLDDGSDVVVKVQRPNIRSQVRADLGIMYNAAAVLERRNEAVRDFGLVGILDEFGSNVLIELDYGNELYNMRRLARNMASIPEVHIPVGYGHYSTSRVLTMEYVEGVKITNLEAIEAAGVDRHQLAEVAVRAMVKQLLIDGFFHGDPHPGNVLVNLDTGNIIFLDCGMVGELDINQRINLIQLLMAVNQQDVMGMAQILRNLSTPFRPDVNEKAYYRDFERRVGRYMDPDMPSASFGQAVNEGFDLLQSNGLRLNPQLTLAIKALVQAETIATTLHPESGLMASGFNITKDLVVQEVTAEKVADVVTQQAAMALREVIQRLPSLQEATVKWLDQYQRGRFEVTIDTSELSKEVDKFSAMSRQIVMGLILVGVIIGSAIAASFGALAGELPAPWDVLPRVAFFAYLAATVIAGFVILRQVWRWLRGL